MRGYAKFLWWDWYFTCKILFPFIHHNEKLQKCMSFTIETVRRTRIWSTLLPLFMYFGLKQLEMVSLETPRLQLNEMFLFKVINSRVDTNLASRFSAHHPQRFTRLDQTFYLPKPESNIHHNSPIYRIQNHHNIFFNSCCGKKTRTNFNKKEVFCFKV